MAYIAAVAAHPAFTARFKSDLVTARPANAADGRRRSSLPTPSISGAPSSGCTPSANDSRTPAVVGRPAHHDCHQALHPAAPRPAPSPRSSSNA